MTDKRIVRISSISVFVALLVAFIVPLGESGRIIAAILLLPAAIIIPIIIKKRSILSINKKQVLLIITVISLLYLMLYYVSGIKFGFYKNPYGLNLPNFFKYFLPVAVIIASSEIIRGVIVAQKGRLASVFCYLACVLSEMLIVSNISEVTTFNRFMDLIAGALFPALLSSALYHYLSKRYGIFPNIILRAVTTLYAYTFPIVSGIPNSLLHFFDLLIPIAIYLFINALYEKKRKFALKNTSRLRRILSAILSVIAVTVMAGTVMLISNHFSHGALVIATESMTGELNKGDVAIYQSYKDQEINEGQVIVFERNRSMVVHRVVDIEIINGNTRYYTKGDANEDNDLGYITDADIVGVVNYKVPFLGYPTIWIRSLFKR